MHSPYHNGIQTKNGRVEWICTKEKRRACLSRQSEWIKEKKRNVQGWVQRAHTPSALVHNSKITICVLSYYGNKQRNTHTLTICHFSGAVALLCAGRIERRCSGPTAVMRPCRGFLSELCGQSLPIHLCGSRVRENCRQRNASSPWAAAGHFYLHSKNENTHTRLVAEGTFKLRSPPHTLLWFLIALSVQFIFETYVQQQKEHLYNYNTFKICWIWINTIF